MTITALRKEIQRLRYQANPLNPQHFLTERGRQTHAELLAKYPPGVEHDRVILGKWTDDGVETVKDAKDADFAIVPEKKSP